MPRNQAEKSDQGHTATPREPHDRCADGLHITMPTAGITKGGSVHYDRPTRSDSNKG